MPKSIQGPSTVLPTQPAQVGKGTVTTTIGSLPKAGAVRGFGQGKK